MSKESKKHTHTLTLSTIMFVAVILLILANRAEKQRSVALKDLPSRSSAIEDVPKVAPVQEESNAGVLVNQRDSLEDPLSMLEPEEFGLRKRRLVPTVQGLMLPLAIQWQFSCGKIDRKQIQQELGLGNVEHVLVSFESLSEVHSELSSISQSIALDSFLKGVPLMFTLPHSAKPEHLGLFICSDSENKKSCSSKPPFKISEDKRDADSAGYRGDRVFFFSYLSLVDTSVYTADYALGELMYPKLKQYPTQTMSSNVDADLILERIKLLNQELQPFQLALNQPLVKAVLSVNHQYCRGKE